MRRCAGTAARKTADFDPARHHVFRHARPRIPVHYDRGELIHAGRVIPGVTEDIDAHRCVEPDGQAVRTIRILDAHLRDAREIAVQELVGLPHAPFAQIEGFYTAHE